MKLSTLLRRARQRIDHPCKWTRGHFVAPGGAVCALGALGFRGGFEPERGRKNDAARLLGEAASAVVPGAGVVDINDTRGYRYVMEMYDIAISMALSDEAAT